MINSHSATLHNFSLFNRGSVRIQALLRNLGATDTDCEVEKRGRGGGGRKRKGERNRDNWWGKERQGREGERKRKEERSREMVGK